ncbi:MAG: ribonuclease HII [Spirochaetaceae bacterium]|nr:ribonuclease HII [Spirochaetaceae bacterium]
MNVLFDMDNINLPANHCGLDEAGRGCLAGPVYAAAVILPASFKWQLADSKKLSPAQRQQLYHIIINEADYSVATAGVAEIDNLNILQASLLAMGRAFAGLKGRPELALVDGNQLPKLPIKAYAIIKGDDKIPSIMAASIVAKVERDSYMLKLAQEDNRYGYQNHKGYPTAEHKQALKKYGLSEHHRLSFKVKENRE